MKMTGEQVIAAPRARVWDALNDPAVLKQCIPGCQSLEKESDDRLKATVAIKIGPIGAKFAGAVTLSELNPPNSYVISGEGHAGTAGFARGGAKVTLADDGAGTRLSYDVDAEVGGRLAQVGGPIVDATAKQLAGTFFKRFSAIVAAAAEIGPATAEPAIAPTETAGPKTLAVPTSPAPETALNAVASQRAVLPWLGAVLLAVMAGVLCGGADLAQPALAALLAIAIAGVAGCGYVCGRRAGPVVVTLDPTLANLLVHRPEGRP